MSLAGNPTPRPSSLAGVRVIDLAGPIGWYAGRLLAGLGADVIRIEAPGQGGRREPPFAGGREAPDASLPYWFFNAGKRAIALDLETDAGRNTLRGLAAGADILIESFPPGWLAGHGLGYESLRTLNPGLVLTSITPFGQTGPYRDFKGSDITGSASSGLMWLAGCEESPPSQPGGDQAYLQTGALGGVASLMALYHRDRSGAGQHVDVSMQEAVGLETENALAYYDLLGTVRGRLGTKNFYGNEGMFQTADGGWFVCWFSGRWDMVLSWFRDRGMDATPFEAEPWFVSSYRTTHDELIVPMEREMMLRITREEAYEDAQKRRIAAAPVVTIDEVLQDPQLIAREFFVDVEQPSENGPRVVRAPGAPFKMSRTPYRITRPAPEAASTDPPGWLAPRPAAVLSPTSPDISRGPLAGIRIMDFTWVIAGPFATKLFADCGADVIRVESAIHPDMNRKMPAPRPAGNESLNVSGVFNLFNSSKRSVTLKMTSPRGLAIAKRLLALSDVVVDNYGVDPYPKWGLTPEIMLSIKPDLIIARAATMGRSGPADFVGNGYTIGAAAGLNSLTGFPNDPPAGTGIAHPDYSSNPMHLATAILAAIRHRDRTGEGQIIDLGQHESTATFAGPAILDFTVNGNVAQQNANRRPDAAPHGAYPCAGDDRWIALACFSDKEWTAISILIGDPRLDDQRFATLPDRKLNEDVLDAIVSDWTRQFDHYELAARLQAAGIAAYPVADQRDLIERDPQLASRKFFRQLEHPEAGLRWYHAPPVHFSETPGDLHRYSPLLGEDNEAVFRDLLGLTEEELLAGYIDQSFE